MIPLLFSAALLGLRPDPAPSPPTGPPPKGAVAKLVASGIELIEPVSELRPEERTRIINVGGRRVTETYRVEVTVYRMIVRRVELKDVRVFASDGKEIAADRLSKLLETETAVLVSGDGRPVDPFYLRLLKEGTLILVIREPAANGGELPPPRR